MTTFQPPHKWSAQSIFDKIGDEYLERMNQDWAGLRHCPVCAEGARLDSNFCSGRDACLTQLFPVGCEFYFNSYCDESGAVLNKGDTVTVTSHSGGMVNVSYQSSAFRHENTTSVWPEELDPTCIKCKES